MLKMQPATADEDLARHIIGQRRTKEKHSAGGLIDSAHTSKRATLAYGFEGLRLHTDRNSASFHFDACARAA